MPSLTGGVRLCPESALPTCPSFVVRVVALALACAAGTAQAVDASRTVVAGGSIAEIVYALGAEAQLVAVDATSVYPPAATELPDIGYLRQLSAEPILSLSPTLLLLDHDAGPPETLAQLRAAGVDTVTVPEARDAASVLAKIRLVATTLGHGPAGEALADSLHRSLDDLRQRVTAIEARPPVLFLLSVGRGAPLAAGDDTSAAAIIELAGGRNALTGFDGYKPVSTEAIAASGARYVLVTTRTAEALGGVDAIRVRPDIAATPAAADGVLVMDGLLLLGFGPRLDQAVAELATLIHGTLPPR